MVIFLGLFFKLIPLYVFIILGFHAAKYLAVKKESVAALLIYIITPVVVFQSVATAPFSKGTFLLPLTFFFMATLAAVVFYFLGGYFFKDNIRNILAFAAGSGNTGYFGLPVALALFGDKAAAPVILSILGVVLFENTVGFYLTARGQYSARQALHKLFKLPALYAFLVGAAVSFYGLGLGPDLLVWTQNFRGAYSVLGMMMVGMAISGVGALAWDAGFNFLVFFAKFIFWPALVFGIIFLDRSVFHIFNPEIYRVLLLMSIVPLAANTVAFASLLNVQPAKASLAVLLTTTFALLYIPVFVTVFIK
jgi:hypothetical protein